MSAELAPRKLLIGFLIGFILACSASAQSNVLFRAGLASLEGGDNAAAAELLASVFETDPSYYDATKGSAVYWWGYAVEAAGEPDEAHRIWSAGIGAHERTGTVDPRLLDAYVKSVYEKERKAEYARAADAYLRLIEREYDHSEELCIAIRHVAQVLPLLSKADAARVVESSRSQNCEGWRLHRNAGVVLASWWRAQDPLLSSERNERLEVHLERVAHAQRHLAHDRRLAGFDDRGEIYIRFGTPARARYLAHDRDAMADRRTTSLYVEHSRLVAQEISHLENPDGSPGGETLPPLKSGDPFVVLPAGMAQSEIWFYDQIDRSGYYVFIKEGRHFRLGQLTDMVPTEFRNFQSWRGEQKSARAMALLFGSGYQPGLYDQLYYEHPDFAAALTSYEMAQTIVGVRPAAFLTIFNQLRLTEEEAAYERDRLMPRDYTDTFRGTAPLPVHVRTARFLDEDGTTRTEIYWQVNNAFRTPVDLPKEAKQSWYNATKQREPVTLTALLKYPDHRVRSAVTRSHQGYSELHEDNVLTSVQRSVVSGATGLYHLALQWAQRSTGDLRPDSTEEAIKTRVATFRLDSLHALSNAEDVLEMSDLVPVSAGALISPGEQEHLPLPPYPYQILLSRDGVGVYFEVYHLSFGSDDRTHYSVEYEIGRRKKGNLRRLFREQRVRTTARTTSHTGTNRTARETILVTLEEWIPGEIELTVRVKDEATGQVVQRSINFEVPG